MEFWVEEGRNVSDGSAKENKASKSGKEGIGNSKKGHR